MGLDDKTRFYITLYEYISFHEGRAEDEVKRADDNIRRCGATVHTVSDFLYAVIRAQIWQEYSADLWELLRYFSDCFFG